MVTEHRGRIWPRLQRALRSLFMEDAYVSRVYYESMRDNFEGFDVTNDIEGFASLRRDFDSFCPKNEDGVEPTLGELFRIELALLRHLPDSTIESRFWSIDDRFRRVVPASVADSYDRHVPAQGDAKWSNIDFVRNQSRCLLDVIHANYLINLGREQSTKRLMFIIGLVAATILIASGIFALTPFATIERQGLVMLTVAGMFGAMISIGRRLQEATSRDAMAQDGIFELIGLRTGWVSILMSICIGGVFALLLYAMVMGGLSDLILPSPQAMTDAAAGAAQNRSAQNAGNGSEEQAATQSASGQDADKPGDANNESNHEAGSVASPTESGGDTISNATERPSIAAPPALATFAAAASITIERNDEAKAGAKSPAKGNPKSGGSIASASTQTKGWADRIANALGFIEAAEFYKMLVLAFLAGFAERVVPDILNKLGKQGKPE